MNIKGILLISFILLVLSLAAASASDLDYGAISDSYSDSSVLAHVPVTVSSHDDSVVIDDNSHDMAVDDSSIDDGQSVPDDGSSIDDGDKSIPADDKKDSSADVDGDINDGDSIIINITNDTSKNNYNDKPISNVKEADESFDDLQSLIDQSPKGTHLLLYRDYKATNEKGLLLIKDFIIDGQGHTLDCAKKCRAFYSNAGDIVLRNLNIINGYYDTSSTDYQINSGGAIWIGGKAKYTLENCNFINNWADDSGGAIYNEARKILTIINCVFKNNIADDFYGGAIYTEGDLHVENSTFSSNQADKSGGAICNPHPGNALAIFNCIFEKNTVDDLDGGAIYSEGYLYLENSTFSSNQADESGGAIYIRSQSELNAYNCVFINNIADDDKGGAICSIYSHTYARNSTFINNWADNMGGAVYYEGKNKYTATISFLQCDFKKNTADDDKGGALYLEGVVRVKDSQFIDNWADNMGGAIFFAAKPQYVINCVFKNNIADDDTGGAIYSIGDFQVKNSIFTYNTAYVDGGAIYSLCGLSVTNCTFNHNKVDGTVSSDAIGGAIHSARDLSITNCTFDSNYADDYGGALFVAGNLFINQQQDDGANYNTFFNGNIADDYQGGAIYCAGSAKIKNAVFNSNKAWTDGGAMLSHGQGFFTHCLFDSNKCAGASSQCEGGAIYGEADLTIKNCIFRDNYAEDDGGALYCEKLIQIYNSTFEGNKAEDYGGAVYSEMSVKINPSAHDSLCHFINNRALDDKGGAIYADDGVYGYDASFISNTAYVDGGAIFSHVVDLDNCSFYYNRAEGASSKCYGGAVRAYTAKVISCIFRENYSENHGGAIFTDTFSDDVKYCTFYFNQAREDGGAVYINNKNEVLFTQCIFIINRCLDQGGAIYADSCSARISLVNNLFKGNHAETEGHVVFNYGEYGFILNNWWADNIPTEKNGLLVEHKYLSSNINHVDSDPLRLAISCPSALTVGKTARATLYFVKSDGSAFTGEIPLLMEFVLPSEYKLVSSGTTMNSIWIDFMPEKAGVFTISGDLFGELLSVTSTVTGDSSSAGNGVDSGFANANSRIVKNASLNTKFAKSLGDFPQSHGGFSIYAVELLILSIFGLQYC